MSAEYWARVVQRGTGDFRATAWHKENFDDPREELISAYGEERYHAVVNLQRALNEHVDKSGVISYPEVFEATPTCGTSGPLAPADHEFAKPDPLADAMTLLEQRRAHHVKVIEEIDRAINALNVVETYEKAATKR